MKKKSLAWYYVRLWQPEFWQDVEQRDLTVNQKKQVTKKQKSE